MIPHNGSHQNRRFNSRPRPKARPSKCGSGVGLARCRQHDPLRDSVPQRPNWRVKRKPTPGSQTKSRSAAQSDRTQDNDPQRYRNAKRTHRRTARTDRKDNLQSTPGRFVLAIQNQKAIQSRRRSTTRPVTTRRRDLNVQNNRLRPCNASHGVCPSRQRFEFG